MTDNPSSIDNPTNEVAALKERYESLMHAMQTGVEYLKEYEPDIFSPKHIRVGINSSLVSIGALCKLLMDKGVIDEVEYWRALVNATREEVEGYEAELSRHVGASITLA